MTNYHYRKYEGAPHTEKKRIPPEPPSKLRPRGKKKPKPHILVRKLFNIAPSGEHFWWEYISDSYRPSDFHPHVGHPVGTYSLVRAGEHVLRRLRAQLMEDTKVNTYWIEEEATRSVISPIFSGFKGITNWLVYEGLSRGWLEVETYWSGGRIIGRKKYPPRHCIRFIKR